MVKTVILFLLVICALAIAAGPGFRRFLMRVLGFRRNR